MTPARSLLARAVAGGGAAVALAAGLVAASSPAGAATFTVTNLADSGAGSLRQAIADANASGGADVVTFDANLSGTIQLTTEIVIDDSVQLVGPGASEVTIAGGDDRIFTIFGADDVSIEGVTLTGGDGTGLYSDSGGAIQAIETDLTIIDAVVTGNTALDNGGAIAQHGGHLEISDSEVGGNSAGTSGGAVYLEDATITVLASSFVGNEAVDSGGAIGAVGAPGAATVAGSVFDSNVAGELGGAVAVSGSPDGSVIIDDTLFIDNIADAGGGVATFDVAVVEVAGSVFTGNVASSGGGLAVSSGRFESDVTITATTFARNEARLGGGLFALEADELDLSLTIDSSTFETNSAEFAGGGFFADSVDTTVINSTFSGNTSTDAAAFVVVNAAEATVAHSTVVGNAATQLGGAFGIVRVNEDAPEPSIHITHTLVDGNTTAQGGDVVLGAITVTSSHGPGALIDHSLINQVIQGDFTDGGGNLFDVDADLGPLEDNGGPTETHLLGAGSAARNAGDPDITGAPASDQRGLSRIQGTAIDIGAVEIPEATPPTPPTPTPPTPPQPAPPAVPGDQSPTFVG